MKTGEKKILFIGAGSEKDPGFEDIKIDGVHYREFMEERGIMVVKPIVIESCHGCFDLMSDYSMQMQSLVEEGHKVVAVLQGGLLFGLPSIQATQVTYPIISSPLDAVAYTAFIVPPGHAAIAGVGVEAKVDKTYETRQRRKALLTASRILELDEDNVIIGAGQQKLEEALSEFGIKSGGKGKLALTYYDSPVYTGKRGELPAAYLEVWANNGLNPRDQASISNSCSMHENDAPMVEVYGARNLAIFAAKILSLQRPELMDKIEKIANNKRATYHGRDIVQELGVKY